MGTVFSFDEAWRKASKGERKIRKKIQRPEPAGIVLLFVVGVVGFVMGTLRSRSEERLG